MGYYAGDFYAGARGDPGFLGSLFSKALSFIPGVGPIASTAVEAVTSRVGRAATAGGAVMKAGKGVLMKHPVLSAAGAAGVAGVGLGAAGSRLLGHRKCKHVNPRTGKCRRHMNVCNARALRRAIRRTHSFAKLAMKTIHLVHPKKKGSFGGFRKRKKK